MMDKLQEMWEQQEKFMELLQERRGFTKFPVDITSKSGQKLLKGYTHECMHELFEANQMLKNSKDHRATDVDDFDRDGYVEELVDALHYFFEIAILSGVSLEELHASYMKKGNVNIQRIENGY
jgi:dimeric dUTPase (all-alpha-NTP-PPase superfamily)